MIWHIYIVECADTLLYTGITNNLERRIHEHNTNDRLGSKFVKIRRPATLVYYEKVQTRSQALKREHEIKRWSKKRKLELVSCQAGTK